MIFNVNTVVACIAQMEDERSLLAGYREELARTIKELERNETDAMQELALLLREQEAKVEAQYIDLDTLVCSMEKIRSIYMRTEKKNCRLIESANGCKARVELLHLDGLVSPPIMNMLLV